MHVVVPAVSPMTRTGSTASHKDSFQSWRKLMYVGSISAGESLSIAATGLIVEASFEVTLSGFWLESMLWSKSSHGTGNSTNWFNILIVSCHCSTKLMRDRDRG